MSKPKPERRAYAATIELRTAGDRAQDGAAAPLTLVGHAAVFNALSEDLGGFREQIAPGAFAQAVVEDDVRALFNHDPSMILGRSRANTLRMSEDDTGLAVEIDLPDTQLARDLTVSMQRGDVDQMSFGFRVEEDAWEERDGEIVRSLLKARLFDVSPVTYPAYPQTDAAVRSLDSFKAARDAAAAEAARNADLDLQARRLRGRSLAIAAGL